MSKNNDRAANIELMRVLAMLGIIIMHYLNPQIGGFLNILMAQGNKWSISATYFIVSIFACAVNLFILITGYYMCQSYHRQAVKPVKLLMQVVIFRVAIYILQIVMGLQVFSLYDLFKALIPVNWYVILYIVLYCISPYMNIVIEALTIHEFKKCICLLLIVFSIYPTLVDVAGEMMGREINGLSSVGAYGSQWGYSIVNFVLLYFVGAYIKKTTINRENKARGGKAKLVVALIFNALLLTCWSFVNDKIGFITERSAWEYCNPLLILETVIIFKIFQMISIRKGILTNGINVLAGGVYSVYLLHISFLKYIPDEIMAVDNIVLFLGQLLLSSVTIYLICYVIHCLYTIVMKPAHQVINNLFGKFVLDVQVKTLDRK